MSFSSYVTLHGITRLASSTNGNPRYRLHTSNGDFSTGVDSSSALTAKIIAGEHTEGLEIPVKLTWDRKDRSDVWNIERM